MNILDFIASLSSTTQLVIFIFIFLVFLGLLLLLFIRGKNITTTIGSIELSDEGKEIFSNEEQFSLFLQKIIEMHIELYEMNSFEKRKEQMDEGSYVFSNIVTTLLKDIADHLKTQLDENENVYKHPDYTESEFIFNHAKFLWRDSLRTFIKQEFPKLLKKDSTVESEEAFHSFAHALTNLLKHVMVNKFEPMYGNYKRLITNDMLWDNNKIEITIHHQIKALLVKLYSIEMRYNTKTKESKRNIIDYINKISKKRKK